MSRWLVALCVAACLGLPASAEEKPATDEPTPLTTFRGQARKLVDGWKTILKDTTKVRERIETTRKMARGLERSAPNGAIAWRTMWAGRADDRLTVHNALFPHVLQWAPPIMALFAAHEQSALTPQTLGQVANVVTDRVRAWVEVGEPITLRGVLETAPQGVPRALALPVRPGPRRQLLAAVAARTAATPETSDLDALAAVASWSALFHVSQKPAQRLDQLSRDLVLLFTERAENAVARNQGRYYVAGRFQDRGFGKSFQDGSDQVRHFAWATRMYAQSPDEAATTKLLRAKEVQDARSRGTALNQKDLALNEAARDFVRALRAPQAPLDPDRWSPWLRSRLGR